jgi:hypothetical protein
MWPARIGVAGTRAPHARFRSPARSSALSPEPPAAAARDRFPYRASHGRGHRGGPIVSLQAARGSPSGNSRPGAPGSGRTTKCGRIRCSPNTITPSRNLAVGESGLRSTYAPGSSAFLAELRANAIVLATLHGVHEEAIEEAKSRKLRNVAPRPQRQQG